MPVTMELCERPQQVGVDLVREMAERIDVPEGFEVEILGGRIHVSAAPSPKHVVIATEVMEQLFRQLPKVLRSTIGGVAIAPDLDTGDFTVPDLVVASKKALATSRSMLLVEDIELVMEVVSKSNAKKDIEFLPDEYALWRIPTYLLIDPRTGDIVVHSEPLTGVYRVRTAFRFGDVVEIPHLGEGVRI